MKWMQRAIRSARAGMKKSEGGPFGACIVRGGKLIAEGHNTVLKTKDATCHAEVNVIREASRKLKRYDLKDCVIYSTTEPCPMCFSAIHWAQIPVVYYGTRIPDVAKRGFNELFISNRIMKKLGKSPMKIRGGVGLAGCRKLLSEWDRKEIKTLY
jgi:tRNA(Arg) A34 adenosine deaminase TadA